MNAHLTLSVEVPAPAADTWAALVDWKAQHEWMLGTSTEVRAGDGASVGARLAARTALGPLGFWDPMEITAWDPPRHCAVRHTGCVVRGTGAFDVESAGPERSRFRWSEAIDVPFGPLGSLGWRLFGRPAVAFGVTLSLRRFARWVPVHASARRA